MAWVAMLALPLYSWNGPWLSTKQDWKQVFSHISITWRILDAFFLNRTQEIISQCFHVISCASSLYWSGAISPEIGMCMIMLLAMVRGRFHRHRKHRFWVNRILSERLLKGQFLTLYESASQHRQIADLHPDVHRKVISLHWFVFLVRDQWSLFYFCPPSKDAHRPTEQGCPPAHRAASPTARAH